MRKILFLVGAAAIFLSCSGSSDDINETQVVNQTPGNQNQNNLLLISSKTQGGIQSPFKFSFTGGVSEQINNINWDFGDGTTFYGDGSLSDVYHNFKNAGTYTVKATLLLANGTSLVKNVTVVVTNTNLLKIKKITILTIPQKTNNQRWISSGASGYWQSFTGAWDESKSFGTTDGNKYADLYLDITKYATAPDANNPHLLYTNNEEHLLTTGVSPNQMNLVFDLTSYNIVIGFEALQYLDIRIKDSDDVNSLLENGNPDETVATYTVYAQQFTSNSTTFTQGSLSFKVEYEIL